MIYNRLGQCGLQVGALSLGAGNWGAGAIDAKAVREMMAAAMDHGIIYFDNAESYSDSNAETVMGEALAALGWPRLKYIVSTKFFSIANICCTGLAGCSNAPAWIMSISPIAIAPIRTRRSRKRSGPFMT
jgi:aryl-alcohol dehydrogenase-like predicted oxidoreductase